MQFKGNEDPFEISCHNTSTNVSCEQCQKVFLAANGFQDLQVHMETAKALFEETTEDCYIWTLDVFHDQWQEFSHCLLGA